MLVMQINVTLTAYETRPATIGRARVFAEKSLTMVDPGMMAMTGFVEAVVGKDG